MNLKARFNFYKFFCDTNYLRKKSWKVMYKKKLLIKLRALFPTLLQGENDNYVW